MLLMMREWLLLLGALLTAVSTVPANPTQRYLDQDRQNRGSGAGDAAEAAPQVVWGKQCSPRLACLRLLQDTILECEVFAPSGTVLSWYKDQAPLDRQIDERNSVWRGGQTLARSTSKVHLSSVVFIDCASVEDLGEYRLEVRTPGDQVFVRHFTVNLTDTEKGMPGRTCWFGKDLIDQLPRIYEYARKAAGVHASDVLLPCRLRAHLHTKSTTWLFKGTRLASHHAKYKLLPSGDLLVRNLQPEDQGMYTCRAYSNKIMGYTDQIHTFVYLMDQETVV
nr:zwei Ig domain protein zig-3-like isoform X2 [Procambarus clarkii]